ncbi:hypothetical protein BX666DRAFT_1988838 [Dichotomocladium elegans]|nr:hypothetical protein BX666DRAFT_1988838 [Dichotomocladium elegans]
MFRPLFSRILGGFFLLLLLCVLSISLMQHWSVDSRVVYFRRKTTLFSDDGIRASRAAEAARERDIEIAATVEEQEQFLSYMRSGGFIEQHDALRSAVRLAQVTNRTIVAPPLRLGNATNWIEIPWSRVLNFGSVFQEFGIRVVDYDYSSMHKDVFQVETGRRARSPKFGHQLTWMARIKQFFHVQEIPNTTGRALEPARLHHIDELMVIDHRYVRFGSLSYQTFRQDLGLTPDQLALYQALQTRLFLEPTEITPLVRAANAVITTLGGPGRYSGMSVHLDQYITSLASATDPVEDMVLDFFSGLPINQAVSAAMPINATSRLYHVLKQQQQGPLPADDNLLKACIEYKNQRDPLFPVFYLMSDTDISKPLRKFFPCVFSKVHIPNDEKNLIVEDLDDYITYRGINTTSEDIIGLLDPIVDLMIAGRGYSHVEFPPTAKSTFVSLLQHNVSSALTVTADVSSPEDTI